MYIQFFLMADLLHCKNIPQFIFCYWKTLVLFSAFGCYNLCCHEHTCIYLLVNINFHCCQVNAQKQTCWVTWCTYFQLYQILPMWPCQFIPLLAVYENFSCSVSLHTIGIICLHFQHAGRHQGYLFKVLKFAFFLQLVCLSSSCVGIWMSSILRCLSLLLIFLMDYFFLYDFQIFFILDLSPF